MAVAEAPTPITKPKPKRIRVVKDGDRVIVGTKPGLYNWYDTSLTRDQVADLILDLVGALK